MRGYKVRAAGGRQCHAGFAHDQHCLQIAPGAPPISGLSYQAAKEVSQDWRGPRWVGTEGQDVGRTGLSGLPESGAKTLWMVEATDSGKDKLT